ncbi:rnh1 [Symbiodinium sp. CCMP2592]|nr:rnh1 [Symbiodinium sp. CCMP2592]
MIHVLMGVWCRRNTTLGLRPRAYFDDSRVSFPSDSVEAATAAWQEVHLFDRLSGQETNTRKSFAVVPKPSLSQTVHVATDGTLEVREEAKVVGHQVVAGKLRRIAVSEERAQTCVDTLQKIRSVGVAPRAAEKYAVTKAMKQFVYGCEVGRPAAHSCEKVRNASAATLWTEARTQRNPEVLFTMLRKGHLVDPVQAVLFQTVMGLRRLFLKRQDLYERARELWPQCQQAGSSRMAGPIRNLAFLLKEAQLHWVDFDTVASRQDRRLFLWKGSGSFLAHRLREELRWSRWQSITRKDMVGIQSEVGVNIFATTCLLRGGMNRVDLDCLIPNCRQQLTHFCGGSLSCYMKGVLEGVLSGATTARYQLVKQQLACSATCIHCDRNVDETKEHMYWECPAWDYIRRATVEQFCPRVWERHPHMVTRTAGITMYPAWVLEEWQRLAQMSQVQPATVEWASARHLLTEEQHGIMVWTDGSTSHSGVPELVRSGLGIFYKPGSALNFCAALAGELQTNNRAELMAVVLAAEQGVSWCRPMVVHSDSSWVVMRARTLSTLQSVPKSWEHYELWIRLWHACSQISLKFVFVPSHISVADCAQHGLTPSQIAGNHAADELAKRGAALHQHPTWTARVREFGQLLRDTIWIQMCMMCICVARAQKETQKPAVTTPADHQLVSQGWAQLQQRLLQAAEMQPTGGRRYRGKAAPTGLNDGGPPNPVEPPVDDSSPPTGEVRRRPIQVHALALRRGARIGDAVSMEWRDVPKPWLLVTRATGCSTRDEGMTQQLGVKPCLLPAMEFYLGRLQWPEGGRSQDISWLELAIDFEVATGVLLEMPRVSHPKHLGTRGRAFSAAASAVGRYVRRRPWPVGLGSQTVNCLGRSYGLPRTSGLAWRPLLLNPETVEHFFRVAGEATYASDADFFQQQPPLLVPSRESEWDAKVRRVPIYVRREERRGHEEEAQLQWCVQVDAATSASSAPAATSRTVSSKLSKKITDWEKRRKRVDSHNEKAAELKLHWVILPEPPDPSLSGKVYSERVKTLKVRCEWCQRERPLSDFGDFLQRKCTASREP